MPDDLVDPRDPIMVSFWVFDSNAWTSKCMCCGAVIGTVFPIDDDQALRLIDHQLDYEGISRGLASEVTDAARRAGLDR